MKIPASKRRKLAGMKLIRGREFRMGSDEHYPEEAPIRRATVGEFWIDEHPVTNAEFAEFVAETGYVTFAEIPPDPLLYAGMPLEMAQAGSAVFVPTVGPVPLDNPGRWWSFVFGADWQHPFGPDSSIVDIMDHPVVQIAPIDAEAYAWWARKELPTEAEWEFAARGGFDGAAYAWGAELMPGQLMANYWQGQFPWENAAENGYERTSPVGAFPPNGYGLLDMIGNVWEWTADWYTSLTAEPKACCGLPRARMGAESESYDPLDLQTRISRRVVKGGSHLCAPNYCQRYRPAARYAHPIDTPTSHIGFRCIVRR